MSSDQPHPHAMLGQEPVATIGRDELKGKLDSGEPIKLVMALNPWAFDAKHIRGSLHSMIRTISIRRSRGTTRSSSIARTSIVSSVALYRAPVARGYRNVRRYAGGLLDWEEAGLTLEGSSV